MNYRPDIDGLRALAIVAVVINHFNPFFLPGGFAGVDVFFVISGYLITSIILLEDDRGTFTLVSFYYRRLRRIFPSLILVIASVIILGWLLLLPYEYETLAKHVQAAIKFAINFTLIKESGYFDISSQLKPLMHLWSLAIEEQFYLLCPTVILFCRKLKINMMLTALVLAVASFYFSLHYAWKHPDAFYFHPLARFWEILLGTIVAILSRADINLFSKKFRFETILKLKSTLALFGFILILISYFFLGSTKSNAAYLLLPVVGAGLIISCSDRTILSKFLGLKPMVFLGLISYPLYLWHWPILSFIRITESGSPTTPLLLTGIALAFILAVLTYFYCELPAKRVLKQKISLVFFLISMMVILYVCASFIRNTKGMVDRQNLEYLKGFESQMIRDLPRDDSCVSMFPQNEHPPYCRQSLPGEKMIALIGDSHAHVLFTGLAREAKKNGYGVLLLANSGCPPLQNTVLGRTDVEKNECKVKIERILSSVESDNRVVALVLATRGPEYITGKGFGPAEAGYNYPPIESTLNAAEAPDLVFIDGLASTINRLNRAGISKISYVMQVPELGVPAMNCLGRPFTFGNNRGGCEVPYEIYKARMRSYRSAMEELGDLKKINIVDLEPFFCDKKICSGFRTGSLLYADDNHLSEKGSVAVASTIFNSLELNK